MNIVTTQPVSFGPPYRQALDDLRLERAFARIADSDLREGNAIALLRDSRENYPAWLEAIRQAQTIIHFENFIIADDVTGRAFADALIERARAGVTRARALRLARLVLPRPARFLAAPARGRNRGQGLQSAPADGPVLDPPQPPQADHRRRPHRLRLRPVRLRQLDRQEGHRALARHGPVRGRPAGGGPRCQLRGELGSRRHEADPEIGAARCRHDCAGGTRGGAGHQRRARHAPHLPGRPVHRGDRAAQSLAHRRLFRRHHLLCAGARRGGAGRGGRAHPRAGLERRARPCSRWCGRATARWSRPASASTSGTARCSTPRPPWRTGAGPASAPPISTSRAGRPIGSSTWSIEDAAFAEAMEAMYLEDLANATEIVPGWQSRRRQARNMRSRRGQRYKKGGVRRLAAGALALSSTVGKAVGSRSLTATEASSIALIAFALLALAALIAAFPLVVVSPIVIATRLARPGASHPRLPAEAAGPPETPEARAAAQACPEQGA